VAKFLGQLAGGRGHGILVGLHRRRRGSPTRCHPCRRGRPPRTAAPGRRVQGDDADGRALAGVRVQRAGRVGPRSQVQGRSRASATRTDPSTGTGPKVRLSVDAPRLSPSSTTSAGPGRSGGCRDATWRVGTSDRPRGECSGVTSARAGPVARDALDHASHGGVGTTTSSGWMPPASLGGTVTSRSSGHSAGSIDGPSTRRSDRFTASAMPQAAAPSRASRPTRLPGHGPRPVRGAGVSRGRLGRGHVLVHPVGSSCRHPRMAGVRCARGG
jgi:hypothetical protein